MPALEAFETVATGLDHPEGIAVGPDGALFAGGEAGQLYRIREGGTIEEAIKTAGQEEKGKWALFDDYNARNVTEAFTELEWE